jgi:hypothetical protein
MRRAFCLLSTIIVVVLLLGYAGQQSGTSAATPQPHLTALHILRTSVVDAYHIRPFETTSTRGADIEQLYLAIRKLERLAPFTDFEGSCPLDSGVDYELTFLDGSYAVLRVAAPISGCPRLVLEDGTLLWWNSLDFWTTFESATGMSASTIWDTTPAPHPPYAPKPTIRAYWWQLRPTQQPTATGQP